MNEKYAALKLLEDTHFIYKQNHQYPTAEGQPYVDFLKFVLARTFF